MSWMGVDLQEELNLERRKRERKTGDDTLGSFRKLLADDDKLDEQALAKIFEKGVAKRYDLTQLNSDRIFSIEDVKSLCIQYRLRFLDAGLFKNEIPYEAILEIKRIQRQHEIELNNFKILAPAPMFNLQRKDRDPLLFLSLGNDKFYLIHKWGGELNPLRKLLVYPFRSFKTILLSVAGLAALLTMSIPDNLIGAAAGGNGVIRVICFFYMFIAFSALTILYGFSRMKDFNSSLWNSKYTD